MPCVDFFATTVFGVFFFFSLCMCASVLPSRESKEHELMGDGHER